MKRKYTLVFVLVKNIDLLTRGRTYNIKEVTNITYENVRKNVKLHKEVNVTKIIRNLMKRWG